MEHKLPADIKTKWLEALRSGKYTQSKGTLWRTETVTETDIVGHCCLGVLCDIIDPTKWIKHESAVGEMAWGDPGATGAPFYPALPAEVQATLGQRTDYRSINSLAEVEELLIWKNDGFNMRQHSFEEIANWIEDNL